MGRRVEGFGALLARQGRKVLEAPAAAPKKTARTIVRIYYTSAGGELLAVDAGPMTWQEADKLTSLLDRGIAVKYERYGMHENRIPWQRARVVVMPSQAAPPVLIESSEKEAA